MARAARRGPRARVIRRCLTDMRGCRPCSKSRGGAVASARASGAGRLWHTGAVGRRSRKGSVGPAWSSSLGDGPRATAPSTPAWIPVTDGLPRMPTECRGVTGVDAAAAKVLLRRALSPTWSRTRSPTRVTPISFRWLMSSSRMTSPVMSFCSKTGARWPHLSEARNEATSWACHSSTGGSPSAAGDTANDGEAIG
jgi:hypothetical protein